MSQEHVFDSAQCYFMNASLLLAGAGISKYIITKCKQPKQVKLMIMILTLFSLIVFGKLLSLPSLYKDVQMDKCLNKRETDKYFRNQLKKLHPDNQNGKSEDDSKYKQYNNLREMLTDKYLRTFYEKYGWLIETNNKTNTRAEQTSQYLFQENLNSLFQLAMLKLLICVVIFYKEKVIEYNGIILKLVFIKTFFSVYTIYFRMPFQCGVIDYIFPKQTLHQQMYYIELWSSFVTGVVVIFLTNHFRKEKKEIIEKCDKILVDSNNKNKSLILRIKEFYHL